jgi:hypothetical protein
MANETSHNNLWDEVEEIFLKMEEKVIDFSCNMALLMVDLDNNLGPLGEVGGSNSEVGSNKKSRDNEDPKWS